MNAERPQTERKVRDWLRRLREREQREEARAWAQETLRRLEQQ